MPELSKIDNTIRESKPPERSEEILSVFFLRERSIYPYLSIHLSIIFNPSSDSKGIVFSL